MFEFHVIDLFSGAGGVTTGIEQAIVMGEKIARVICAINHDEIAIESHWRNHPHVHHFVEDIRNFDVTKLPKVTNPIAHKFLWASLECTNHSNAKGGLSRDADSRTLAEHLLPYIKEFNPKYIGIENVREFKDWGPLIQKKYQNGKLMFDKRHKPYMIPDPKHKGEDFEKWIISICMLGYHYEMKILNAADFGAHTSRKRLFIIFAKEGLPIAWPDSTHDKLGRNNLPKWKPVKECLDFSDKGENIFGRKKDLCENTYKRIYAGLVKFIANGDESFITKWFGNNEHTGINKGKSINDPSATITTQNRLGLVQTEFLVNYNHSSKINSIKNPSPTLTTHDKLSLISAEHFIDMQHGHGKQNESVNEPVGAIQLIRNIIETGEVIITIEKTDTRYMRKIKMFMAAYSIIAIYMRMLRIPELKRITGFSEEYILEGTQADQKKFIGNAVPPVLPKAIFEALYIINNPNAEIRIAV